MKRFITIIVLVVLILTISGVVFYVIYYGNIGKPKELNSADRYNPYYADAIQMKKPELCKKIKYALQSGPTDEITVHYGLDAVSICKSQAADGQFGCMCDGDEVLNRMRVK